MGEVNSQIDILNHIIEVEKEVSVLIENATADAEKKVAEAKQIANAEFQEKNAVIQRDLEKTYEANLLEINNNRDNAIQSFINQLQSKKQSQRNLNAVLDKLLFNE